MIRSGKNDVIILEVTIASEVLPYMQYLTHLVQYAIECESIVLVCITVIYQVTWYINSSTFINDPLQSSVGQREHNKQVSCL